MVIARGLRFNSVPTPALKLYMDPNQSWWCAVPRETWSARQPLEEVRMRNTLLEPGVKRALMGIEWLDEQEGKGIPTRRNRIAPKGTDAA